jgi:hypothetical protein
MCAGCTERCLQTNTLLCRGSKVTLKVLDASLPIENQQVDGRHFDLVVYSVTDELVNAAGGDNEEQKRISNIEVFRYFLVSSLGQAYFREHPTVMQVDPIINQKQILDRHKLLFAKPTSLEP